MRQQKVAWRRATLQLRQRLKRVLDRAVAAGTGAAIGMLDDDRLSCGRIESELAGFLNVLREDNIHIAGHALAKPFRGRASSGTAARPAPVKCDAAANRRVEGPIVLNGKVSRRILTELRLKSA